MTTTRPPDLDLSGDDALLERLWRDEGERGRAAFAFDPDRHPRDGHGRWASLGAPTAAERGYLKDLAGPWAVTLTAKEAGDLQGYKGSAFYPVNKLLRNPDWPDDDLNRRQYGTRAQALANYRDHVAGLDAAIARSVIDRPVVVHRGVSGTATALCAAFDAGALVPGTEITDRAYTSTSLDPAAAASFKKGWGTGGVGAVLHIALSPGDRAAHVGHAVENRYLALKGLSADAESRKDVEHELLLPRDTTFRVLRTYEQGGLRHIDCAVVRQEQPRPPAGFAWDPDRHPRGERGQWAEVHGGEPWKGDVEWAEAHAKTWAAGLTGAEAVALDGYKGADFYAINKLLRDPEWPESEKEYGGDDTRTRADQSRVYGPQVALLDAALARSVLDERPLIVHRGFSATAKSLCAAFDTGALAPGAEFTDAGFGSTSLKGDIGDHFKRGWSGAGDGMVMHVRLEPGQHAAHLGAAVWHRVQKDAHPHAADAPDTDATGGGEYEMLLPRNTTYRVLATYTRAGVRHMDCEVARQDPPPRAAFYDESQARDGHGRWAEGGGAVGSLPDGADAPPPESAVDRLEKFYRETRAKGADAPERDLETWRYGLWAHDRHTLDALHERLGLPRPAAGEPVRDPGGDIVKSLYAGMGRSVPHAGDNIESRERLAEMKKWMDLGVGYYDVRHSVREWLVNECEGDQVRWIGEQLGVPVPADGSVRDQALAINSKFFAATRHPGEDAAVDQDWRRQIAETLAGGSYSPVPPDWMDRKLADAPPEVTDYLVRSLGFYAPGMTHTQGRRALFDALAKATENVGRTPATEAVLTRLRDLPGGVTADWREREALARTLGRLDFKEQRFLHREMGLLGARKDWPVGTECVKEIVARVTPPVADRIAADRESAEIVAKLSAAEDEIVRNREEDSEKSRLLGLEMVKWYEAADKAGPLGSDEREAWKAVPENAAWKARVDEMGAETERLLNRAGLDRLRDRRRLYEAMGPPPAPVKWKVKHAKTKPEHRAALAAAVEFFARTLSLPPGADAPAGGVLAALTVRPTKTRARARRTYTPPGQPKEGTVWLSDGSDGTAVHELGHHVEYHCPGAMAAALDFLKHRVKDEPAQSLKTLFKDYGYKPGEKGRRDDFGNYFGAGDHRAYYCGKDYDGAATEIVSMGVEYLYKDPLRFCKMDPEYARFVVGILRGTLR